MKIYDNITDNQIARLWAIANENNWNDESLHYFLYEDFNLNSVHNINSTQYDEIINKIQK